MKVTRWLLLAVSSLLQVAIANAQDTSSTFNASVNASDDMSEQQEPRVRSNLPPFAVRTTDPFNAVQARRDALAASDSQSQPPQGIENLGWPTKKSGRSTQAPRFRGLVSIRSLQSDGLFVKANQGYDVSHCARVSLAHLDASQADWTNALLSFARVRVPQGAACLQLSFWQVCAVQVHRWPSNPCLGLRSGS